MTWTWRDSDSYGAEKTRACVREIRGFAALQRRIVVAAVNFRRVTSLMTRGHDPRDLSPRALEGTMATKQFNFAMVCLSFGFIAAVVFGIV
jgi:hypothetical protein